MASLEEVQPSSGNTSQDSKGSGGQKSMLELLSITDAAVKALNKSTRSQSSTGSQGSRKSHNSDPLVQSTHSDRSVKSECSDHTVKSTHSGHSVQSGRSGHSARSHLSGQSQKSHQSGQSREDNSDDRMLKPLQTEKDTSYDSGVISKTHTISEEKNKQRGVSHGVLPADGGLHERSSDESTTASDILIRSTIDKSERSFNGNGLNGNSSITSKCSKTSYGAENFNSSGPQKVKISKKHLREIKSPFEEESPRDSVSSDGKVPSALFGVNSKSNSNSDGSQHSGSGSKVEKKISPRDSLQRSNMESNQVKNGGKSFPRGIDSDQFKVEKVRKSAEKPYEDVNMVKTKPKTGGHVQQTSKNKEIDYMKPSKKLDNGIKVVNGVLGSHGAEPVGQARSTPKYFVERHTPQKSQPKVGGSVYPLGIPEKKNLLQDLEDSVEIVTTHAKDTSSASSSQPEIVTIPERIVTVSAKMSLSPASSISDFVVSKATAPTVTFHSAAHRLRDDKGPAKEEKEKNLDDSNVIPPALSRQLLDDDAADDDLKKQDIQARSQWFSRQVNGHGLQQGAPVSGHEAPDRPKDVDVHISDYKLSNKQKSAKEMFARRQGGPVRRIVQPRLVGHDSKASSTSSTGECKPQQQLGQSNDQVLTAAAAASAAVAATQPFLKAQHEMETKMEEVLTKINELQSGDVTSKPSVTSGADLERVQQLERQVADMTERRIEYMEAMQAQQMAMQAKLLSMTREASTGSRSYTHQPRSHSPESHVHRHDMSTTSSKKAFSKTTIHKPPIKGEYHSNFHKYSALDAEQSASQLDTPNPRARAPRPTIYDTSEIEFKARSRSPKAKSPKARSPVLRPRSKSPTKESQDRGILHQILASSVSPEPGYPRERPHILQTRRQGNCESPNVKKAKGLVEDLSQIKDQVKGLVDEREHQKYFPVESSFQEPTKVTDTTINSHIGPSPLDSYLHLPEHAPISPYKSVPELSISHFNAPVLPGFKDAEKILHQVQQNRGYLESNMETVLRARQEVEVYSMLEALHNDSNNQERARIQKMVDHSITKLRREVEREVSDAVVIAEINKKKQTVVPGAVKIPAPVQAKPVGKYGIRGRLKPPEPKVEPKKSAIKRPGVGGKENVQYRFARPAPKVKSKLEDEEYMTRVYGKASYQKGRTTVKDPYLHFQNTAKQKAPRPSGTVDMKGKEMMSSKTQTSAGGVRQFFFNPTTGTYIPIASAATAAPIPGQLIPMAVPLGGPRMDSGLTAPAATSAHSHVTFDPSSHVPQVTAAGNVAMVSVGSDEKIDSKPSPELGKQVLPAVDIDTDLSEMSDLPEQVMSQVRATSPEVRQKKRVHIVSPRGTPGRSPGRSPVKAHYEVVYHEDDTAVSDEESDVETATGLEFPGYQPAESPEVEYNGPTFPPKQPSADRQITAELIAADIKRRDLIQNKTMDWLEQELMARIITEMYPLKDVEEPADLSHILSEGSEDSMAEEREKSMFVMDSIGHHGMQLFVDAGCPVDNALVNNLVKEVLQEKIRTMLGTRPDQQDQTQPGTSAAGLNGPQWEEPVSEDIEEEFTPRAHQVRTPEPTPRASPASSPQRRVSPARTPVASPPPGTPRQQEEVVEPQMYIPEPQQVPQPVMEPESESESSASYDIKEELNRLADQLHPNVETSASFQSRHDIATPPESPKPEPPPVEVYRPLTPPEPSPRLAMEEMMMMSQKVMPAAMSKSPERTPQVSKSESPKSTHVSEDIEDEMMEDQPKPVVFTVAETQTEVEEERRKSRSPSPAKTHSRTPSESSYTESSSISDTFNECISEGQWLVNKSDGEVADFPINEAAVRDRMLRQKKVDVSSASTWKDTDDVDLDEATDMSRSEGEFLYKTDFPPEKDPVLDLLARLQSAGPQYGGAGPQYGGAGPKYGMYDMSQKQVTDVLNTTGKSEGEVIRVAPRQELQHQQPQQHQQRHQQQQQRPVRDLNQGPANNSATRSRSPHYGDSPAYSSTPQRSGSPKKRAQSPIFRTQSPTRVSFEGDLNDERSVSPTRSILKQRSTSFEGQGRPSREEESDLPVRDSGRSRTPTGRITPGGRQPQGRGMISAGGRTASQVKSSMRKPPQVIKSSTLPESRSSGSRLVNVRGSSEDYRDSMENTAGYYSSEMGTRTMTPDQMNMDALIQSGYLSQSFSQSEINGRQTGQSSLRSSGDLRQSRTSAGGRSLGHSYGTEGSLTMSELQRLATGGGAGKLQMSFTIPGTDEMEDTDLSEIDITDGGNTK